MKKKLFLLSRTLLFVLLSMSSLYAQTICINELDSDQTGIDSEEFVELKSNTGNVSLDGYVLVLFNGNMDESYNAIDLDGFSTDANGFFVIGNVAGADIDETDIRVSASNFLQNGADAVALFLGDEADFPNGTPVSPFPTGTTLVDALVYDTSNPDDMELLTALGETTQYDEGEGGVDRTIVSIQQTNDDCASNTFVLAGPTPGAANTMPTSCDITNLAVASDGACDGNNAEFTVTFDVVDGSGDYEVLQFFAPLEGQTVAGGTVATGDASVTGQAMNGQVSITVTVTNVTELDTIGVDVRDANDLTCSFGSTVEVIIPDCFDPMPTCPNVGDLVITEIMNNPSVVSDSDGEYFEVYNPTGSAIDLLGFVIKDTTANNPNVHTINQSVMVPAGGYAVLGINDDNATNGGVNVDYQYGDFFLGNSGDEVVLECDGVVIDQVIYNNMNNFPDPNGASINLNPDNLDATDNDDGNNWCESTSEITMNGDLGTPGAANDACNGGNGGTCDNPDALILTAVFDGPLPGGLPKGIEIYVAENVSDLSAFGIGVAANGNSSNGTPGFTFPADMVTAGTFLYVSLEDVNFFDFFGFNPDYTTGILNINGDDAIELYCGATVVDVFGEVGTDGSGEAWDYSDGWAYRNDATGPDGSTFVLANWSFSGVDALDGETDNASATTPVPIGDYSTFSGGCPTNRIFDNQTIPAGNYAAANSITTSNSVDIASGAAVTFNAQTITLGVGFTASSAGGTTFTATVNPCTPLANNEVEMRSEAALPSVESVRIAPNPLRDAAQIQYELSTRTEVVVAVTDMNGKVVAQLVNGLTQDAGLYQLDFNAADWAAGLYFVLVRTDSGYLVEKMSIVK